jgi:hypothetical protein
LSGYPNKQKDAVSKKQADLKKPIRTNLRARGSISAGRRLHIRWGESPACPQLNNATAESHTQHKEEITIKIVAGSFLLYFLFI